jgi:hypothetical protein
MLHLEGWKKPFARRDLVDDNDSPVREAEQEPSPV